MKPLTERREYPRPESTLKRILDVTYRELRKGKS
jgi:hypothetical protein